MTLLWQLGITTASTGGTITTSGAYTIHTFTSSGTFTCVLFSVNSNFTFAGIGRGYLGSGELYYAPGTTVDTLTGQATLTGFAPTVTATQNVIVSTGLGSAVLTGFAPTVQTPVNIETTN